MLYEDEALLVFLDTDERFKPLPEETFIWAITKTDSRTCTDRSRGELNNHFS